MLRDFVRAGEEPAVGPDPRQSACRVEIDETEIFGQLERSHSAVSEIRPGYSRYSSRRAARLDKTALRVFAGIENPEGMTGRTIGIIKTVRTGRAKVDWIFLGPVMAMENVARLYGEDERRLGYQFGVR
jgi:hypothetical protein